MKTKERRGIKPENNNEMYLYVTVLSQDDCMLKTGGRYENFHLIKAKLTLEIEKEDEYTCCYSSCIW
jgi:hypothetical protein